jgi:hypothetical protein
MTRLSILRWLATCVLALVLSGVKLDASAASPKGVLIQ